MGATLKDVARLAGVSYQAVSAVLNGNRSKASPATCRRILSAARELHYRPNRLARALASGRTGMVGFVMPEFNSPYFADLNRELQVEADRRDRRLLIMASRWDAEETVARAAQVADYAIDGLLLVQDVVRAVREQGILPASTPIVLMGSEPNDDACRIGFDYLPGIRQAFGLLSARGCRDVVLLHDPAYREKYLAYRQVCRETGTPLRERHYLSPEQGGDASLSRLGRELAAEPLPDAFFVASDYDAAVVMQELSRAGVRLPDDVSLVSMDDTLVSRLASPALTTIRLDRARLARLAFDMIYDPGHASTEMVATELVVRDSVRAEPV